ncbi:uncharacterized protein [Rutidosis leptorrhynchoides]|uniref:uncharacterized protein n=1 Tax=Rutidosis leptorrhynchoides TaxID=125765 RepID=UPI003A99C47F
MQPTVSKCANIRDDDITNVRMDEISCQKNLAEQFGRSPSDKELCDTFHNDNIDSLHVDNMQSSVRKRKSENVMPTEKIVKIKTSSNSGVELPSGSGTSNIGPTLEHLTQIHTRFFKETKLLPDSVDKMNLHAIDRLIDTLGQLQTSKTYELLASKFQSHDIQNKRAIEAKLLLCKIVHEKAKSQLLHVKRERLLKNGQSLASGIQESEVLKLNLSLQNSLPAQVIPHRTDNIKEIQECQVDIDKVKSMRQVIKDMDERILSLTKSFHGSCKMKGEPPNPTDTIANVNDHLLKRARCHIIRKDMQLWVIDDFKSSKDHHEITLNYLNFMSQRITVTAGVIPSFSFSHSLNQTNINKIFKDMDASAAFGFVFNGGLIQKYVGATSLAQETQITSHLFGNLVDVLDEIQLARLELPNLMRARFHTSLDEQLHLELYFFNATSGKKATVSLNTSCLKRGIYPPEIAPCQIDIAENASQNSSTQTLSAQITAAVKDLRVGYLRIKRLCRCVSQLVGIQ